MKTDNREWLGIWIPKEIYLNQDVCWSAKIIFMEIHSFTANGKECYISNAHLAEFLNISETQVSKHISTLIEKGWIKQTSFDGRKRYLQSCLSSDFKADLNQTSRQSSIEFQSSLEENFNHTNTINNTDTKTSTTFADSKKSAKNDEDYKISVEAYFTFYEKKSGMKPKFDGVDGKALKSVLKFLQKLADEGGNVHTKSELLKIIFDNWTKIEPWLQERFTIRDINTNLNKILTNLKNGKANATDRSKTDLANYAQELTGKRY